MNSVQEGMMAQQATFDELYMQQLFSQAWQRLQRYQSTMKNKGFVNLSVNKANIGPVGQDWHRVRLKPDWDGLIADLQSLGPVKVITRNDLARLEQCGRIQSIRRHGSEVCLQGDDIELHIDLCHWLDANAVEDDSYNGFQHRLQFCARDGDVINEVQMTNKSCLSAFRSLVRKYRVDKMEVRDHIPAISNEIDQVVETVKRETLVARPSPELFPHFLQKIFEISLPVSLIVSHKGVNQIQSGTIGNLVSKDDWLCLQGGSFRIQIKQSAIAEMKVIRRMARKELSTVLELYDNQGRQIAQVTGLIAPKVGEDPAWRDFVLSLPGAETV